MTDPEIFLIRHGKRVGPYTMGSIVRFLATKSISPHDLAWYEGLEAWIPVATLPLFAAPPKPEERRPLTVVRSRSNTSPLPRIVSTRVARITEQNKMISGEHRLRRRSGASGPLFAIFGVVLVLATFFYVRSHWLQSSWTQEYAQAMRTARDQHKLVFLYFARPETCQWCQKLDAETFSQREFQDYAAQNLVVLKIDLDSPRYSNNELRELSKRFRVQSVPTIIVLNSEDEMLGRFGYKEGGPPVWIGELNVFKP